MPNQPPSILELKKSLEQRIKACNDLLLTLFYEKEELESDLAKINYFLEHARVLVQPEPLPETEAMRRETEPVRCLLRPWLFPFIILIKKDSY